MAEAAPVAAPVATSAPAAVDAPTSTSAAKDAIRETLRARLDKPAETAPVAEPAKPAAVAEPDVTELIQADRRVKAEAKKLETERAAFEAAAKDAKALMPAVDAARKALAEGRRVDAVKALLPDIGDVHELFFELAALEAEPEKPVDVAATVATELERREKAAKDAAEAAKAAADTDLQQKYESGRNAYLADANTAFQAGQAEYPGIVRLFKMLGEDAGALVATRVTAIAEKAYQPGGAVMQPKEALAALNKQLLVEEDAKPAAVEAPKPAATVTRAWQSDAGRPSPEDAGKTYRQLREEAKERMRQARQ